MLFLVFFLRLSCAFLRLNSSFPKPSSLILKDSLDSPDSRFLPLQCSSCHQLNGPPLPTRVGPPQRCVIAVGKWGRPLQRSGIPPKTCDVAPRNSDVAPRSRDIAPLKWAPPLRNRDVAPLKWPPPLREWPPPLRKWGVAAPQETGFTGKNRLPSVFLGWQCSKNQ